MLFRKQSAGNLSICLVISAQVLFSHEMLSEAERAYCWLIFVLSLIKACRKVIENDN